MDSPFLSLDPILNRDLGSRFAVRAVLPDVDATDERPTLVERDGNHISILSGKMNMAVWAARRALEITW